MILLITFHYMHLDELQACCCLWEVQSHAYAERKEKKRLRCWEFYIEKLEVYPSFPMAEAIRGVAQDPSDMHH